MSDVENLLRRVLAERAQDIEFDPTLAHGARNAARQPGRPALARWGVVAAATAAAVTAVVVAVHGLTDGSGSTAPASPATPSPPPVRSVAVRTLSPSAPTAGTLPAFPPGRVPLTPGGLTATPVYPGGCRSFATAEPSTPEPPPPVTSDGTVTTPPLAGPSASGDGAPGDPFGWIGLSPTPAVIAVTSDLAAVLDGLRFAGFAVDHSGRSITVQVVEGPSAEAAATLARGCARADVPVNIGYVTRSGDVLTGLAATLARSLPASLQGQVETSVGSAGPEPTNAVDVERNRVVIYLNGTLTAAMKRDLWVRYGDALEVWLRDSRTLAEPAPSWAKG